MLNRKTRPVGNVFRIHTHNLKKTCGISGWIKGLDVNWSYLYENGSSSYKVQSNIMTEANMDISDNGFIPNN